jgi:HEPN domain-containing protein
MKIVGYIKIEEGLHLTSECLDKSFSIAINGIKGTLLTPSLPLDYSIKESNLGAKLMQPKSQIQFREDGINWGRPISWPDGDSDVHGFMIEFDYSELAEVEEIGIKIKAGIENWIKRFRVNLFAFEYNIDSPGIKVENNLNDICEFFYKPNEKEGPLQAFENDPQKVNIFIYGPINLNDFEQTLKVTSDNKSLILEYQLLKEANLALKTENYRKSILDSASALELSLTNAIKREIKINEELLDEILKMNNSISKKKTLMKFTQYKLSEYNFQRDIEDIRNKAIHIGKTPTEIEARTAYLLVKEVIARLSIEKFDQTTPFYK